MIKLTTKVYKNDLTREEAERYILGIFPQKTDGTFETFKLDDFVELVRKNIEEEHNGELKHFLNELIKSGKLRIEYEYFHAGPAAIHLLVIRRIV